eukprot:TRINITY_DN9950_c0_g1_i1.p1 TRINITY_DN9950_c0_g1~~TRINITY_DN9950_c0_g1_i1.p1  ORF type:complete len:237 (+),score=44.58 TRINITY_DN9950_c0_g1_i1:30-740(+)
MQSTFLNYSTLYDDINNTRDLVGKLSRDITKLSKRLIFLLHRISFDDVDSIENQVSDSLSDIYDLFSQLNVVLEGKSYQQFQRYYTGGLQEFIEAVSFYHYLIHKSLITKQEIESMLVAHTESNKGCVVTTQDYLLGIADLTGELMRMCITSVSSSRFGICSEIATFLKEMLSIYTMLPEKDRELNNKIKVMKQSVAKVENVCLTIVLRKNELSEDALTRYFAENKLDFTDKTPRE